MPSRESGLSWSKITKEMTSTSAFKTLRTELKTQKGFYNHLEMLKKKKAGGAAQKNKNLAT